MPAQAYHVAPIEPHGSAELDPSSPFGMGLYLYRYSKHPSSLEEMDRAAQMARDAGVKWSREEFNWARIQPRKGKFDWFFYDIMVATAKRHGISIYGLLSYWSAWSKPYSAEGIDDYCRFAAAAATRYGADIQHWEVWITEMGWATHVPHDGSSAGFRVTTQRDQAQLLARAYVDAVASDVAPNISWYDFRNDGTDPFNFEYNLGIVTRDFRPKPAYRAFATVTRMLKGKRVDRPLDLGPAVIAYRFVGKDGKAVCALWSTEGQRKVAMPTNRPAVLVDLMGSQETLKPDNGSVTVALQQETPVFLVFETPR